MRPRERVLPLESLSGTTLSGTSLPGASPSALAAIEGLVHAVTTRTGGVSRAAFSSLNLGRGTGDDQGRIARNRRRVAGALGFGSLTVPHQVHGVRVCRIEGPHEDPGSCDALSTNRPGLLLGVLGADCPGVLLVEPERRVLAVVHAGWRGVAGGIIPAVLEHLRSVYGAVPDRIAAGIGPGISRERYEVSEDVAVRIREALPPLDADRVIRPGRCGHVHVDLVLAIRAQLATLGVAADRIAVHGACTFDDARFFSHRRDRGVTGRHALLAGWALPGRAAVERDG